MVHEFYIDMDNPMISESSSKAADGDETSPTTTATEDTVVNHTATREIATVSSTTDPIVSETFTCIITDMTDPSNSCKRHVINLSSKYTLEDLIQEAGSHYAYDPFTFCLIWKSPSGDMINVSEIQANNLNLAHLGLKVSGKNLFEIHEKEEGPPKKLKPTTTEESNPDEMPSLEENLHPTSSSGITPRRNALYCPWETVSTSSPQTAGCSSQIEFGPANMPSNTLCGSFGPGPFGVSSRDDDSNEYVGLINQAMTCYLNSLIQTLYMTPEFRNGIYRWNYQGVINDEEEARKSIPYQLQRLFLNLQTSKKKSIHTQDLTKSFGWNNDDAFQQHDVQELCRVMFDALEKRFKGTRQENLINELYQGKVKDYVKCLECQTESARVDVFLDIPLCIRPFGSDKTYESVEAALDAFVQPEILDENNKYFCAKCNKMCKAHKGLKLESFPYILSLQLKRFDFDYKTMSRIKLSNTVSFPEVLNVEKYLKKPSNNDNNEDESTNKELQVDEIIEEEKTPRDSGLDYELFSIMIHSGSATGGHYYAYIKSFETNQWYNFNDERVSRIDKEDIIKAYGHSHSTYSSTTAYMLFYRLRSDKRNEKVMHVDNFDEHLRKLLDRERNQQIEADRLKEYMENVCKIKCIAPAVKSINGSNNGSMVATETDDAKISSTTTNGGRDSREQSPALLDALKKKVEKTVEIHKDLTLEMAKEQIIKEFELGDYLKESKKKARILKYDTHNELIEQSYANESTSVFEALGFTKYAYNVSWLLELVDEQEEFVEYNSNDCSVKVCHVDMQTFETSELFTVRLPSECTIYELRERIAQKLNVGQSSRLRMALEKLHTLYNYVYLNSNLMDTLRQMNFTRVNKVFVDWTETSDDESSTTPFETSKFYYTLDTIINMLNMVVYLPNEEQCNLFVKKTQRHKAYIENKLKQLSPKTSVSVAVSSTTGVNNANDENTVDSYENVPSVLSQVCDSPTLSSMAAKSDIVMTTTTTNNSDVKDLLNEGFYSPISTTSTVTTTNATTSRNIDINFEKKAISVDEEDSASKMSFQETSAIFAAATAQQPQQQQKSTDANFSLIEDHFKIGNKPLSGSSTTTTTTVTSNNNGGNNDNKLVDLNLNDMETSLDEGIGSSGSLSTNTNTTNSSNQQQHNQNKNSPSQSVEMMMMNSAPPIKLSPIVNNEESMSLSSPQQPQQQQNTPTNTKTSISDEWYYKGGGSHTMGGLDLDDVKNNYEQERAGNNDDEDETNLGDVADRCFDDVADLDVNIDDNEVYNIESDSETATNGVVGGQREKPLSLSERADQYTANSEIPTSGVSGGFFEPYWDDPSNSHQPNFHHHNESKVAHKNTADLFLNDDALPKYSEIANTSSINKQKFISTSSQQVSDGSGDNRGNNFFDYFNKLNDVRYIKSTLNVNDELSTRTLEIKMDKRIDLSEFKSHVDEYLKISVDNFRVFRMCPNDLECELTSSENQFLYLANNSKFLIKLGPPLKYGEYVLAVFKMNKTKGNFAYLCEFMCFHGLSVLDHKEMLVDDLKDELDLQIPIEKMRLRKKITKRPGAILLDHEVFGTDIFVNAMTELCIEILDEPEKKSSKLQTSIYLRHWKPDEYELGELKEAIIEGNAFDNLLTYISEISKIPLDDIEVLKCKRDYPFNSPILDLHRDQAWKDNYFLQMEKLEDGACFYYRNKTLKLGTISEEKKKEMEKEDNLNFRTNSYSIMPTKKETGIKII